MAYQTSYSLDPAIAVAGQIADSSVPNRVDSFVAEGTPTPGNLVQRGTDKERQVIPVTSLAADVDAIVASGGASAATAQTIQTTALNGVVGQGLIIPAQQVTMTLNNHADWDATTAVVKYENAMGEVVEEEVSIPNGGNTTISTVGAARRVLSIYIPAQTGTNGTFTVGTTPTSPVFTLRNFPGVAVYDSGRHPYTSGLFTDKDPCPVLSKGRIYVTVEDAVTAGDPVYVRAVTSGADIAGQFGGERATNFGLLLGAHYVTSASQDGLAIVELG